MSSTLLTTLCILISFLSIVEATPSIFQHPPTLAKHVEHYLSHGGQRALQARLKLPRGVYYNPLHHFTREDIHSSTLPPSSYASDLSLLRALDVHIPGIDPIQEATLVRNSDASCDIVGLRIVTGKTSEFAISYSGSTPDYVKPPVERAVQLWSDQFSSRVRIRICFSWAMDLGGATLGAATSPIFISGTDSPKLRSDASYSPSMASALSEVDVLSEERFHVKMVLNSKIAWHVDTVSPAPFNRFDVTTTVLHELTHGLFFSGAIEADGTQRTARFSKGVPGRFDQMMQVEKTIAVAQSCTDPKNLFNAITNPTLRFVNGESKADFGLYAPGLFASGSSIYHFNNETLTQDCERADIAREHCSDLMTPQLNMGYTQRSIGETTSRVLKAMMSLSQGVEGNANCSLPDSPLLANNTEANAFRLPTWGKATVGGVAAVGAILVAGVIVSSIVAKRSITDE